MDNDQKCKSLSDMEMKLSSQSLLIMHFMEDGNEFIVVIWQC